MYMDFLLFLIAYLYNAVQAVSFKASDLSRSPPHTPEKAISLPKIVLLVIFIARLDFSNDTACCV